MRLDDASEHMDIEKWMRMKSVLDKRGIKPIYGIIPDNRDPELLRYGKVPDFWELMREWRGKGWTPAMHGCSHVFETWEGGINPVNRKSEFAGLPLARQREKVKKGYRILADHGIKPDVFFAPAHTFDENTLQALYLETPIRIISDTLAWDAYYREPFYFIPQQSGMARNLPFQTVTFCYHPNLMDEGMFAGLERFLGKRGGKFAGLSDVGLTKRKFSWRDSGVRNLYWVFRRIKRHPGRRRASG